MLYTAGTWSPGTESLASSSYRLSSLKKIVWISADSAKLQDISFDNTLVLIYCLCSFLEVQDCIGNEQYLVQFPKFGLTSNTSSRKYFFTIKQDSLSFIWITLRGSSDQPPPPPPKKNIQPARVSAGGGGGGSLPTSPCEGTRACPSAHMTLGRGGVGSLPTWSRRRRGPYLTRDLIPPCKQMNSAFPRTTYVVGNEPYFEMV